MAIVKHTFPLDLSGKSRGNRVVGEVYRIGSQRNRVFIPTHGPFYSEGMSVMDMLSGRVLKAGEDYRLLHYYKEPSERAGKSVYGGVVVDDRDVSDRIIFGGQHVGGEYSHLYYAIRDTAHALSGDTRPIYWMELSGVPKTFAPAPHRHHGDDFVGWGSLVVANSDIAAAVKEVDAGTLAKIRRQVQGKLRSVDSLAAGIIDRYRQSTQTIAASAAWSIDTPRLLSMVRQVVEDRFILSLEFSDFSVNGIPTTGHKASDYVLASDPAFTNIVWSSLSNLVNKISIRTDPLSFQGTLYLRARYQGIEYPESGWSYDELPVI